jgi:predicted signal transduction protein with EAL and GGDEF domain
VVVLDAFERICDLVRASLCLPYASAAVKFLSHLFFYFSVRLAHWALAPTAGIITAFFLAIGLPVLLSSAAPS